MFFNSVAEKSGTLFGRRLRRKCFLDSEWSGVLFGKHIEKRLEKHLEKHRGDDVFEFGGREKRHDF